MNVLPATFLLLTVSGLSATVLELKFPELPPDLHGNPAMARIALPDQTGGPVPLLVWFGGGHGTNDPSAVPDLVDRSRWAVAALPYASGIPRRTLAIVSIKCPDGSGDATTQKTKIPILICIGKNDKDAWVKTSVENYEKGRQDRAVWTLAFHPTEGHESGATRPLAEAFLNEVIPLRLGTATSNSNGLKSLSIQSAWLGDLETLETAPAEKFQGQKRRATWLPGPQTAEAWRHYLQTTRETSFRGEAS